MSEFCPFCSPSPESILRESPRMMAILDKYPVSRGHTLIIPKTHKTDFFELDENEILEMALLLREMREHWVKEDERIQGVNIGIN